MIARYRLPPERAFWVLSGGTAGCLAAIFTASMVYQVTRVGLSPLQLVLVGTTLELTVFCFEVPTGIVADVYSRRLSILIGLATMGLGFVVEGSWPAFAGVLVGQFLWGMGFTFTSGATQAWIVDEVGETRAGEVFLRGAQVDRVCELAGIGLGVVLGSAAIAWPIVLGGCCLVGLAGVLAVAMPEHNFHPAARAGRSSWRAMAYTLRTGVNLVRVHPALLTIFGIGLFYGLYSEGYDRLSTAHMLRDMSLPALGNLAPVAWFGIMQATGAGLSLAAAEIVRRKLDTTDIGGLTRVLFGFSALLTGALLGFALAGDFWLAALLSILIGVVRGLIAPLYDTWINHRLDSRVRATVISMSSQVDAVGQVAGGPGVGWIGDSVSVRAALLASTVILSPVLWLYWRATRPGGSTQLDGEISAAGAPADPA